uniref:Ribosomal protein S18 n=1 Tax=Renouxia sp. TaxID=2485823 RepID=A0A3G3MHH0_9FLOR|nr:ribosomal protein S18 [Renouxia sp.]
MTLNKKKYQTIKANEEIDYKDTDLLGKFITEQGKILPKRITGLSTKQQKKLTRSIKKARILSFLPFLHKD